MLNTFNKANFVQTQPLSTHVNRLPWLCFLCHMQRSDSLLWSIGECEVSSVIPCSPESFMKYVIPLKQCYFSTTDPWCPLIPGEVSLTCKFFLSLFFLERVACLQILLKLYHVSCSLPLLPGQNIIGQVG